MMEESSKKELVRLKILLNCKSLGESQETLVSGSLAVSASQAAYIGMENNDLIIITNFLGQKKLHDILLSNSKNINYKVYANLPFSYDQKKIIILAPATCY